MARRQAIGAFSLSELKPIGRNKRKHNDKYSATLFSGIAISQENAEGKVAASLLILNAAYWISGRTTGVERST